MCCHVYSVCLSAHYSETILSDFIIYYFYGAIPDKKGKGTVFCCLSLVGPLHGCHQLQVSKPRVRTGVTGKNKMSGCFWSQTALQANTRICAVFADNCHLLAIG